MFRLIIRLLTVFTAWTALLANTKLPNGRFILLNAIGKAIGSALSPFLTMFGGLAAIIGLLRRDKLLIATGVATTALAAKHIHEVTQPHDSFNFALGPNWQERIPHHLHNRLLPQRYAFHPLPTVPTHLTKDYVIGQHRETGDPLLADIWQPAPDGLHTGVGIIYLHGSVWHYIDKDYGRSTRPFFQYLANQGYLVADVGYTLAPKASSIPMVADVKRAIAWMRNNADELGINPNRIVLVGGSAGAHLALLAAYTPNHPLLDPADVADVDTAVRGVVSYYGITDLVAEHEYLQRIPPIPSRIKKLIEKSMLKTRFVPSYGGYIDPAQAIPAVVGGAPDEQPELYQLLSPITHVHPNCPPTLLLNGTHDVGVAIEQHRQLYAALYRQGVTAVHVEYSTAEHAFDVLAPRWAPGTRAALYDLERFLALLN
jgi:acetyl esterase/lipase